MNDPIREGTIIFEDIANTVCPRQITDPNTIQRFFEVLMAETGGLVIVDFLDTGNWDRIQSFQFDAESRELTLIWRDDDSPGGDQLTKELRKELLGTSSAALSMTVRSIRSVLYKGVLLFAANGHFASEKDLRKRYKPGSNKIDVLRDDLFKKTVIRETGGRIELIDVHTTPIFSIAILPKNCYLPSHESRNILYWLNLKDYLSRLDRLKSEIDKTNSLDEDAVSAWAMASRRILEFVLKLECCYHDILVKNRDYNKLELGDLVKALTNEGCSGMPEVLKSLVRGLNEFSHTSGAPVFRQDAADALDQIMKYTRHFHDKVA